MTSRILKLSVVLPLSVFLGCSDGPVRTNDSGNGDDFFIPIQCPEGVDPSVDVATAIDVLPGEDVTGQICPQRDIDYYKVHVKAGDSLLRLNLTHPGPTQVNLTYRLLKDATTGVGAAPPGKFNNFAGTMHCLAPGDYYLLVQDSGDDAADNKKHYTLNYTTTQDPDKEEPNDNKTEAKPISGTVTGYISCTGDKDFYTVTTKAGELLDVKLTTTKTTEVDFKYTLYQINGKNLEEIVSSSVGDGSKKPTNLAKIYAPPKAGTYYLVVQDDGDDDSDATTPYTLTVAARPEPDAADKITRNDHPKHATVLGTATGAESPSSPKVFTTTGSIASIGDVDVFKINNAGLAGAAVIEIQVKFNGATVVDPAVSLIIPDTKTTCTEDRCCQVLGGADGKCSTVYDCSGSSFSCVTRSQEFCNECLGGADPTCAQKKSCAGSVTCLADGHCGYFQFTRSAKDGALLRTAQPLYHPGPWFIRVSDMSADEYDYNATYTLTVKIAADPDGAHEPDYAYFPRLVSYPNKPPEKDSGAFTTKSLEDYFDGHEKPWTSSTTTITGHISYEHDVDLIKFPNPCPTGICLLQAKFSSSGNCGSGGLKGAGLEFIYLLDKHGGRDGFPASPYPNNGTFGGTGDRCAILVRPGMGKTFTLS
ncbi:MAG: PPC domain-containing protein, partial [Deltaproteobacteria bacterium]|nr:PPC domain-containing protein [Deltaproteobacteria bacterium]